MWLLLPLFVRKRNRSFRFLLTIFLTRKWEVLTGYKSTEIYSGRKTPSETDAGKDSVVQASKWSRFAERKT